MTPGTVAHQALLSVEFSRQEYWRGLPFPTPVDLPNPGIKPRSLTLQADSLLAELSGKPLHIIHFKYLPIIHWAKKILDAFELWCWRRLLKGPLDSKEIKPVNHKGNQPEYSLEGLMLKLKLQYFGHLM